MRNSLAMTLKKMIRKDGPDKITVAKLVGECQIFRSLFCYYFADPFDAMVYYLEKDLNNAVVRSLKELVPGIFLSMFLGDILSHREEIGKITDTEYREQAEREMMAATEKYVRKPVEKFMIVIVEVMCCQLRKLISIV